uniref:hypothetical protein n=1 Tax=Polaromonas sp. AER18D-145 TaxID=1977060 RepID=UPI00197C976E
SDTYVFQSGDGLDTILDSDGKGSLLHDGDTLAGGAQYGDTRVYKSTDGKHLYTLAGESTLIIDGQIVVQGYDKARADLGITYSDAPVVNNPDTNNDIKGDLKPIDTNPNQDGDQLENDALGNIKTGNILGDIDWLASRFNWSVVNNHFQPTSGIAHPAELLAISAMNDAKYGNSFIRKTA